MIFTLYKGFGNEGVLLQISPRMWSLWPLLYKAFNEWAMEYLDNILVPLNNFISKGTEVFLACKSPDYLAQVRSCRPHNLARALTTLQEP